MSQDGGAYGRAHRRQVVLRGVGEVQGVGVGGAAPVRDGGMRGREVRGHPVQGKNVKSHEYCYELWILP